MENNSEWWRLTPYPIIGEGKAHVVLDLGEIEVPICDDSFTAEGAASLAAHPHGSDAPLERPTKPAEDSRACRGSFRRGTVLKIGKPAAQRTRAAAARRLAHLKMLRAMGTLSARYLPPEALCCFQAPGRWRAVPSGQIEVVEACPGGVWGTLAPNFTTMWRRVSGSTVTRTAEEVACPEHVQRSPSSPPPPPPPPPVLPPTATSMGRTREVTAVELKPKNHHLAAAKSTLVPAEHAVKFVQPRFQLTQNAKLAHGKETARSMFTPSDLFGGSPASIFRALCDLARTPQNNLTWFRNCVQLPSFDSDGTGDDDDGGAGDTFLSSFPSVASLLQATATRCTSLFVHGCDLKQISTNTGIGLVQLVALAVLAQILAQEPVLMELAAMQEKDIVDIEGADLVFSRLGFLLGTPAKITEALLDAIMSGDEVPPEVDPQVAADLGVAAFTDPEASLVDALRWRSGYPSPSPGELGDPNSTPQQGVERLSAAQCVQLLVGWLLALAANDCSLMISMQEAVLNGEGSTHSSSGAPSTAQVYFDARGEDDGASQAGSHTTAATTTTRIAITYCIGLTDIGPKPASKIRKKASEEGAFLLHSRPDDYQVHDVRQENGS